MKNKLLSTALGMMILLISSLNSISHAGIIALESTRGVGNQNYSGSLAMYFDVTSAINVTELGAFDSGLDGFISNIQVGIFDRNTNLMVTEIATLLGTSNTLIGNSRFFDITDVKLEIGNYAIVARGFGSDSNGNAGSFGPAPIINDDSGVIQFIGGGYFGGSSITDFNLIPDSGPANRYDAGTFIYNRAMQVPEPSTLAIFALGVIGLASRRFKK